jgi:hypothetical protein
MTHAARDFNNPRFALAIVETSEHLAALDSSTRTDQLLLKKQGEWEQ